MADNDFHGKLIKHTDYNLYPKRRDFTQQLYRNDNIHKSVSTSINKLDKVPNAKVLFLPNDIRAMDTDFVYNIYMFGILMDGSKTLVILKDVPVYLDIRYPKLVTESKNFDDAESQFIGKIREEYLKNEHGYNIHSSLKTVYGYPLKGFNTKKVPYLRVYFDNIRNRGIALSKLQKYGVEHKDNCSAPYELASNDNGGSYHNKIQRDYKYYPCGWNYFTKAVIPKSNNIANNCEYVFEVSVDDFKPYDLTPIDMLTPRVGDDEAEIERRATRNIEIKQENTRRETVKSKIGHILDKDRTMVAAWDIETWSDTFTSAKFTNANQFTVFMVCITFHWHFTDNALVKVCLVDKPTNPSDEWLTIVCENEYGVMLAFIELLSRMSPDLMCAFNGGNFDWNCMNIKLKHYKTQTKEASLMDLFITKMSCIELNQWQKRRYKTDKSVKIKISADQPDYEMTICDLPGMIDTDVMPVFKQLYPRSEIGRFQGLNFFAQKNNLGGKEDMPYKVMFAIYEGKKVLEYDAKRERVISSRDATPEENLKDMCEVARYCVKDALLCQQLYAIRSVIPDKRELSNMSRTTIYESFYLAGGSKVLNTLGYYCNWYDEQEDIKFDIMFDNHHHQKKNISYPGGYVPEPIKGLEADLPITGLDFASLYPSLQMTYNFSPDKTVKDPKLAEKLKEDGYQLHPVNVPLTTRTTDTAGTTTEKITDEVGWMVRHCEHKLPSERLPGEHMGIIPYILRKLFADRNKDKQEKVQLSMIKEKMEVEGKDDTEEFKDVLFRLDMTDTKQKAKKIIMNTFYGKAGDSSSSIFEILVSGGITSMGQYNIKKVGQFAVDQGCILKYGDTDSVYVSCPQNTYTELDAKYADMLKSTDTSGDEYKTAKLKYHEEKVHLTMQRIATIRDDVNAMLIADNGTKYLKVAYEEVLHPVVFTGKKKYFGIAHEGEPKFVDVKSLGDIFIRGVDIIKQGQTELARKVGFEIMRDICSIYNTKTLMQLVKEKIKEIYTIDWDVKYFVQKLKYRPDKNNVRVHTFVRRMKEERARYEDDPVMRELFPIPNAGEPFECVVVKKHAKFADDFSRTKLGVGDQMEYIDTYTHSQNTSYPMQIDLDYYIKGAIIGLFSRFVSYYPDFQSATDAEMISKASKYVSALCKEAQLNDESFDSEALLAVRTRQRSLFNNTKTKFNKFVQNNICGGFTVLQDYDRILNKTKNPHITSELYRCIKERAIKQAEQIVPITYGVNTIKELMRVHETDDDDDDDVFELLSEEFSELSRELQLKVIRLVKSEMPPTNLVRLNKLYGKTGYVRRYREKYFEAQMIPLGRELGMYQKPLSEISEIRSKSISQLINDCNIEKDNNQVITANIDIERVVRLDEEHLRVLNRITAINAKMLTLCVLSRKDELLSDALSIKLKQVDVQKFIQNDSVVIETSELGKLGDINFDCDL